LWLKRALTFFQKDCTSPVSAGRIVDDLVVGQCHRSGYGKNCAADIEALAWKTAGIVAHIKRIAVGEL
jgi:hypothetical protein